MCVCVCVCVRVLMLIGILGRFLCDSEWRVMAPGTDMVLVRRGNKWPGWKTGIRGLLNLTTLIERIVANVAVCGKEVLATMVGKNDCINLDESPDPPNSAGLRQVPLCE